MDQRINNPTETNNTITNITNIYEINSNNLESEELITRSFDQETEQVVEFINEFKKNNSEKLEYESEEHIKKNTKGSRILTAQSILDKNMDKDNFILKEQQQRSINGFDSSSSNIGINIDIINTSSSTSSTCEGMIHDQIINASENINNNVSLSSRSLSLSSNLSSPIQSSAITINNPYMHEINKNSYTNFLNEFKTLNYENNNNQQMHENLFISFVSNEINFEKRFEYSFNI